MSLLRRRWPLLLLMALAVLSATGCVSGPAGQPAGLPKIEVAVGGDADPTSPQALGGALQIVVLLTVLSVLPSIILLMTPFTCIFIVLALTRMALGIPTLPPNQVIAGLALFLAAFIAMPVWEQVDRTALKPYLAGEITLAEFQTSAARPIREFMFKRTYQDHLVLFLEAGKQPRPERPEDIRNEYILPAFVLSEVKTGLTMGALLFLPFLIIDLVIGILLVSLGMMFMSPATIALPFKIMLFVLVDGYALIVHQILLNYRM